MGLTLYNRQTEFIVAPFETKEADSGVLLLPFSQCVNRNSIFPLPPMYIAYKMRFNERSRDNINRVDEAETLKSRA